MKPLLSIVVPTKDRYQYLNYLVDLFVSIPDKRLELVIQDNSDRQSDDFLKKLEMINDGRIKYFYHPEHISVVENCDKAILNSNGEYVTMIGDDDGFIPQLVEYVEKMSEKNMDVLLPQKAMYMWPDIVSKNYSGNVGSVTFQSFNKQLNEINPAKELKKCLDNGGRDLYKMPRIYHAVVSRNCLNKVFKKTNSFFPGPSPDMANAVALSLLKPKTYFVKLPLIISGKGYKSTGGAGMRRAHVGRIEDIRHLPKSTADDWEKNIPRIWTGPTIYAESVIKALKRFDRVDLLKKFNFLRLYGNLTGKYLNLIKEIRPFLKWYQYPSFLYYFISFFILRTKFYSIYLVKTKFKFLSKEFIHLTNIDNIITCSNKISSEIDK
jgi:glycosyltransferase involved in cell wall biosynthesis